MRITILSFAFALMCAVHVLAQTERGGSDGDMTPVRLEGWKYRWGDSPVDASGIPEWVRKTDRGPLWKPIRSMIEPPGRNGQNFVWYRIRLPQVHWHNPAIYFPTVAVSFEVYLDSTRIYRFGEMRPAENNKNSVVSNHLVPLPAGYPGQTMTVRVFSQVSDAIGLGVYEESVWIGSEHDLIDILIRTSADSTFVGHLCVFVGLFSALFAIRRFGGRSFFSLSFATFAFFIGLFFVFSDPFAVYVVKSPGVKLYARFGSFLIFPIGLYVFLQQITGPNKLVKSLWMSHVAAAVIIIFLDIINVVALPLSFMSFSAFFACTIAIAAYLAVRAAIGGNRNARIYVIGFTILSLTGLHDLLVGLRHIPFWRWMSHWGALVFIVGLTYILARTFERSHKRLREYSQELEQKSEELHEYSQTLERRVAERTQDLDAKNQELEGTLIQLKEAQQQLVLKEKMASLGDLVAGVAHEMNNPIGAINSAADVSRRCLERLKEIIANGVSVDAVLCDKRFRTAMRLLRENTDIAVEGSSRVTRIIRSLKNFARLDEAELKDADIHEGIESTLTLLHHELKNKVEVVRGFGEIPQIKCYPNQLNQVFMNLFVNAAHAIEDKGILEINTNADDKSVYIRVADNGHGIDPDHVKKIFDPGFTTKSTGIGTGLGLSISYNIIEKHGGSIEVESEVGKGTEFIITLPIR
ncbi:MAG: hypothetical protein JSW50_11700 [Candidatus Latescibacterota bacterium]|nr:MAG: hypothetical protein JSW50_11700 [Candidatus Latescibacterota bacterium]